MAVTTAPVELHDWEEGPLRRAISRRMLLFFVLGDILGAGIYALKGVYHDAYGL